MLKVFFSVFLIRLKLFKYIIRKIRAKKDLEIILKKLSLIKKINITTSDYSQILLAYNCLNNVFKLILSPIALTITISIFIKYISV